MIFFTPVIVKYMENNLHITKPSYNEHIFPVPWFFVISWFHCMYTHLYREICPNYKGFNVFLSHIKCSVEALLTMK